MIDETVAQFITISAEEYRALKVQRSGLRDQFAAAALQGLIAQYTGSALNIVPSVGAEWAYRVADAMMEARDE